MALAGSTLRYIVYDLITIFKQTYDDSDITPYQMTYWVLTHADRLRKQHIEKRDTGEYLAMFDVDVSTDTDGLKYITIPQRIYDMDKDRAIKFIAYQKEVGDVTPKYVQQTFSRVAAADAQRLYYRTEETPSATNPYFFRVGDIIKFLGLEEATVDSVEVGLITTLDPSLVTLDLDQPFDFPQDLLPVLQRQVLDIGLLALQTPRDLNNDGTGEAAGQAPQRKMTSVQDFSPADEDNYR